METNGKFSKAYEKKALFDTTLDYLYTPYEDFSLLIKPELEKIYTDITCEDRECYFNTECAQINKRRLNIAFRLGKSHNSYDVMLDLEDYLIDDKVDHKCYLPIFTVDIDEFENTWFLGNMFMDKYLIVMDHT